MRIFLEYLKVGLWMLPIILPALWLLPRLSKRYAAKVSYVIWLVPGIVPWFFFQEAMNAGTGCLQEYHDLVKKVVFNV